MTTDTYLTIQSETVATFKDKGSKFIAYAFPIANESDFKTRLEALRKEHFNAVHHCFAYRLKPDKSIFRSSDDGEPTGSAGKPILNQLLSKDLTNVAVIVVRYFGGTLLGVSGLIHAYKEATRMALETATVVEKIVFETYRLEFPYDSLPAVMKLIKDEELLQEQQQFDLQCSLQIKVRQQICASIIAKLQGLNGVQCEHLGSY
jgi:uncharacterized YigZ family protein